MSTAIVWFRNDLRLADNPAWAAATARHERVVPLFVLDPPLLASAAARRRDLLLAHLGALDDGLRERGGRLMVRSGNPVAVLPKVLLEANAAELHWNHNWTPYASRRDSAVASATPAVIHHGRTVHPVGSVTTAAGGPFSVFTPFHRRWSEQQWEEWPAEGDGSPTVSTLASRSRSFLSVSA